MASRGLLQHHRCSTAGCAANDDHLGGILYASRHRAIAAVLLLQGLYVAR
ncbi:hypothetical protein IG631_03955 [Alternaria alternata]|nr:hypothetical protein IG631_03955 [Alternaria alternata]